jgi:hypothetical protein
MSCLFPPRFDYLLKLGLQFLCICYFMTNLNITYYIIVFYVVGFFCLCPSLMCPMLPVSLDCPFSIVPSVFSKDRLLVIADKKTV